MSTQPVFPAEMIVRILEQTARDCTRQWGNAHNESSDERYDYIIAAVKRLDEASGGSVGGNWRRAVPGDLSMDGISVIGTDSRYHFIDVIIGAGGPNPRLIRPEDIRLSDASLLRDSAGVYVHDAGFVKAHHLPAPVVGCGTVTPPIDPPKPPPIKKTYPGDRVFDEMGLLLEADYKAAGQQLNGQSVRWMARTIWDHLNEGMTLDESTAKHRSEWRTALGLA